MKIFYFKRAVVILSSLFLLSSCNKHKTFQVVGKIDNADGNIIYLEKRGHNDIICLDSLKLNSDGDFKFVQKSLDYPEFYKIRIKNKNVDFVVDSTEVITITGDYNNLDNDFKLEGTNDVMLMQRATKNLHDFQQKIDNLQKAYKNDEINDIALQDSIASALNKYKDNVKKIIFADLGSSVGYYVLFLRCNGTQILNPNDKQDLALFRTVATLWGNNYANSPRYDYLKNYTLTSIANEQKLKQQEKNINKISEILPTDSKDYFEVRLPNINGDTISTKEAKGKIMLLDFVTYDDLNTRARNTTLKNLYNKYKGKIEIYQVSFDQDERLWKSVANSLPWLTVRDANQLNSPLLSKFNLFALPTVFIINSNGEITKRVEYGDDVEKIISSAIK